MSHDAVRCRKNANNDPNDTIKEGLSILSPLQSWVLATLSQSHAVSSHCFISDINQIIYNVHDNAKERKILQKETFAS